MGKKAHNLNNQSIEPTLVRVRIDKWLWAARFFRTRSLAKKAIEGGKVHFVGEGGSSQRVKTSKEICISDILTIRQGSATSISEKTIIVKALSETRGNASIAQTLYQETDESISRRDFYHQQRKLANLARPDSKPNKKQRRELKKFKSDY